MFRLEHVSCLQAKRDDCYNEQTGSTRSFRGNEHLGEEPEGPVRDSFLSVVTARHVSVSR